MVKKLTKIIGLKKDDFDNFVKSGEVSLSKAHLIPFYKPGHEKALTSVILSSIKLIKEFRKMILSESKMIGGGQIYVFTEVSFSQPPESIVDGLLIIVKSGIIKDAAIFEMKNENNELEDDQIERYIEVAKTYSIPRLITVSNQFVSEPTQSPANVKPIRNVELFHFSWSYLLTIARVLLFKNNTTIEDEDQVEIMHEVVNYLEYDKSGVCGLNQMNAGWSKVVEKINSGVNLNNTDTDVGKAVISWQQEEKDMALILSRRLGVLVNSGELRHKGNLKARLDDDMKSLINDKQLVSTLRVRNAVSDIKIIGSFEKRTVEMIVSLKAPQDKKVKGQLGWIKRQIENCRKRNETDFRKHNKNNLKEPDFKKLENDILIEMKIKNRSQSERIGISNLDNILGTGNSKEIKEFGIVLQKDFGKRFASPKKFVELIEQMIVEFYNGIIQYLYKWEPSAPKMVQQISDDVPNVPVTPIQESIENNEESKEMKT